MVSHTLSKIRMCTHNFTASTTPSKIRGPGTATVCSATRTRSCGADLRSRAPVSEIQLFPQSHGVHSACARKSVPVVQGFVLHRHATLELGLLPVSPRRLLTTRVNLLPASRRRHGATARCQIRSCFENLVLRQAAEAEIFVMYPPTPPLMTTHDFVPSPLKESICQSMPYRLWCNGIVPSWMGRTWSSLLVF